jgi:hypothetical protein
VRVDGGSVERGVVCGWVFGWCLGWIFVGGLYGMSVRFLWRAPDTVASALFICFGCVGDVVGPRIFTRGAIVEFGCSRGVGGAVGVAVPFEPWFVCRRSGFAVFVAVFVLVVGC